MCYGPADDCGRRSSQTERFIRVNATTLSSHLTVVHSMEIAVTTPGDDDELTKLVVRVRGGNAAAFEELARRVRDRVRQWARRLVADDDEAEDVAQLVLVRMHERLDEFEGRSRFGSWLYRITRNVALERRRGEARRSALLARELASQPEASSPTTGTDVADDARIRSLIASHFAALPSRQREVFELVELRGLASSDVAVQLGIDASTVRVLLLRARRTIRARLLALHPNLLEDFRS